MRKGTYFAFNFWDSPICATLRPMGPEYLWVFLHLNHGPNVEVSGIYRASIGQIAEDAGLESDVVRRVISGLCAAGWCDYEAPVIWIRGTGNINDKLGTDDFRKNPSWLKPTMRHLDALPQNRVVRAFRAYHFGAPSGNHDGEMVTGCQQGVGTLPTGVSNPFPSSPLPSPSPESPPDPEPWTADSVYDLAVAGFGAASGRRRGGVLS